ncbi:MULTISPECIES: glycine--tRNA ligase subunit beta [Prochlorococcus]|uniref:Glycine--tRNA ligase beta subunit n=1 Tax=Prochlorococcus marinus (strain SARG / CCMP1375 / SS120) TaxID=167539 RepID=Q7VCB0_PROMA|nr:MULTISPECIES: glycine--tRNA ligase subunit beta [Prochlorococcus]AAP99875.1 Glycyl-tRNA synthetase beta subunit [Prochlorococcus marinus subsp. marinus str. CCMP1375]KGG11778.1 Glycyl-tRNA synthetase beta chain [Prochlorococcus marinus str. LG]KGG18808.1 Glycyl-tRNA synthetase beta chain [Prochlorococcus marinus str. SS2]KGG23654.1 Glycyl-tRNA synthetase beta chain [Prochlorococcus marinus str. SS35]KGG32110.1 Glycyl-tRNA synthetase beta chain [Prochlorococcus marinus str. SS51]
MSNFLLEIGTEELPADFARLAISQLEELVQNDLKQNRIQYELIRCSSTPRRIFVIVNNLASSSDDFVEERKGPPATKAFKNGCPTPAAEGFAKRYGLLVEDLEIRETVKGPFVFGKVVEKGGPSKDLLVDLIPNWINSIQGKRFMRWGSGDSRFSRPVRWLVALLDDNEIKVKLPDTDPEILSGRLSRGHRLVSNEILIESSGEYFEILRGAGVIVDREERLDLIKSLVEKSSLEVNATADLTSKLLNELTDLVELPYLIRGEFNESFLELPAEVLSTVMQVHQRYIPLYKNDDEVDPLALEAKGILTPFFLCICNGLPQSKDLIKEGNERVLKARFADAKFFINADRGLSSTSRTDQLKNVTFADGLGSLYDRVKRIEWLAELFIKTVNFPEGNSNFLRKASSLCKHDLVSHMVGEFPELQGIIGAKYLLAEGESREVALAVLEQYLPRGYADKLPESFVGSALALIERIELLLSIYSKGERPSGSSDPYALRRAGNGVLQIIWNKEWKINLLELLTISSSYWLKLFPSFKVDEENLLSDLLDFFHQRIVSLLEESSIDVDIIQAVAGETIPHERLLADPTDVFERVTLLQQMRTSKKLSAVQSVVNRASKLAEKGTLNTDVLSASNVVDPSLFESQSENSMLEVINSLEPIAISNSPDRYMKLAEGLAFGSKALAEFFDGEQSVMVMTTNKSIRENRLNLLSVLRNQAQLIADFNLITH